MKLETNQKEELKEIQSIGLEILKKIKDICDRNNIQYFLLAGTLLGAVRHGGYIPWDEDIDIGMLREDYERFVSIAKKEISYPYYYMDMNINHKYFMLFSKLYKTDVSYYETKWYDIMGMNGLWVDVFPIDSISATDLDNAKKVAGKRKQKINRLMRFINIRQYKESCSTKTKLFLKITGFISTERLIKAVNRIMQKDKQKACKFSTNYASGYGTDKQTMPIDFYLPTKTIKFEDEYFNAPNKIEEYLTHLYGDYMQLPPIEKQVIRHHLNKH